MMTKRGDERRRLAVGRAGSVLGERHVGLRPGLIDKHEALGIEPLPAHPESLPHPDKQIIPSIC